MRENAGIADRLADPVACVHLTEVPPQTLGRDVLGNVFWINARTSFFNVGGIEVGCEDLQRCLASDRFGGLHIRDCQRIGLLPGRATKRPDSHGVMTRSPFQQSREHHVLQSVERLRVAKETRHADQDVLVKCLDLGRCRLQEFHILTQVVQLLEDHAARDAAVECVELVLIEIDARRLVE